MPEPTPVPPQKPRSILLVMLALIGVMVLSVMMVRNFGPKEESWSKFLENVSEGKVAKIVRGTESLQIKATKQDGSREYVVYYPSGRPLDSDMAIYRKAVDDYNTKVAASSGGTAGSPALVTIDESGNPPPGLLASLLPNLLFLGLLVFLFYMLFLRRMGGGGGVLSFGKSRAQLITKGKTGKTFKDVAGIDEAKEEVEELVAFLKNPKKFQKLGGRIPRGVLLVGPPGTGKTLLAKAIAGEADVPFYSISGSDFVEMFVGVGASRVRDLFAQAKENAPCIIFIDEIDAVGRKRGSGQMSGGHDEREQTLNAILVEMDGFASTDKVIVIAATNRVDVLDPALQRPGRFDRHIYVNLPDIAGREQILNVHAGKVKLDPSCLLTTVARGTPGFSGADLESLINEAALNAARHEQETIQNKDLEYARDRVAFGRERKAGSRAMPEQERRITAYHEAGHTLLQVLVEGADELHKVTIIPRGRALGATMHLPNEDRHTHSRKKILGDICVLYGGRLAEELFCGDITTGASNDIERATTLARGMVYEWGMSDRMGPMKYTERQENGFGPDAVMAVSAATQRELDQEVRSVLEGEFSRARKLIEEHRDQLERVAAALLEHETLDGAQVKILLEGGELPPRRPTVAIARSEVETTDKPAAEPAPPGPALEPKLA
jgi:cell division protease FtsH